MTRLLVGICAVVVWCSVTGCGNGPTDDSARHDPIDPGEDSNSGNNVDGDSADMNSGSSYAQATERSCGNGTVEEGENCDDGNRIAEICPYGALECEVCGESCLLISGATQFCGDGEVNGDEACDAGTDPPQKCDYGMESCQICTDACVFVSGETSFCGDGFVDTEFEQCELGCETCKYDREQPVFLQKHENFGGDLDLAQGQVLVGADHGDSPRAYLKTTFGSEAVPLPTETPNDTTFDHTVRFDKESEERLVVAHHHHSVHFWEKLEDGSWVEKEIIKAPVIRSNDFFGISLALCGDMLVIGDPWADDDAQGAVYVYRERAHGWNLIRTLISPNPFLGGAFGRSVDCLEDRFVVSEPAFSAQDPSFASVYQYEVTATEVGAPELVAKRSAVGENFGRPVALTRKLVLVGATGVNGYRGAVYAFRSNRDGFYWQEFSIHGETWDAFYLGTAIDVSQSRLAIGAPGHIFGAANYDNPLVVILDISSAPPKEIAVLRGPELDRRDRTEGFGDSVAIDGDTVIVGAPQARRYSDDPFDDLSVGAIYRFEIP